MPLTVEEIKNRRFTTVRIREGYDIAEVDSFLSEVEKSVADYTTQINKLVEAVNSDPGDAPAVTDTVSASRAAARMLEVATAEAETVLSEARSDSQTMVSEAREEAELVRVNAARDQSRLREDLARRRTEALEAFAAERDRLRARIAVLAAAEDTYRHDIGERMRSHLELLERATPRPDGDGAVPADDADQSETTAVAADAADRDHVAAESADQDPGALDVVEAPEAEAPTAHEEAPAKPEAPSQPEYHRPEPAPTFGVGSYGGRTPQSIKRSTPSEPATRQQPLWPVDTDRGTAPATDAEDH